MFSDLNNCLYVLDKKNSLSYFCDVLDNIEVFVDTVLGFSQKNVYSDELNHYPTDKCFSLVGKFFHSNYPLLEVNYDDFLSKRDNVILVEESSRNDLYRLLYQRFVYYLNRSSDIDIALKMLEDELANSGINKNCYLDILEIFKKLSGEVSGFFKRHKLKKSVRDEIERECLSKPCDFATRANKINIVNTNDSWMVSTIIHEFMHVNNYDRTLLWEKFNGYFSEFVPIAMELEIMKWLYDNSYADFNDYKYAIGMRVNYSISCAEYLKLFKIILDVYKRDKIVSFDSINNEVKKIEDETVRGKLLDKVFASDYFFSETWRILCKVNYFMSFVMAGCYVERFDLTDKVSKRSRFISICQDNDISVYDGLNMINMNFYSYKMKNKMIWELSNYLDDYYSLFNYKYSDFKK